MKSSHLEIQGVAIMMKDLEDQLVLTMDAFDINKVKFDLEPIEYLNKPTSALWTSSVQKDEKDELSSEWREWCIDENFANPYSRRRTILIPKKDTKVFQLNWKTEKELLTKRSRPRFIFAAYHVDWSALVEAGYDGFNLPCKTGLGMLLGGCDFSAWDCESTVWFNTDWIDKIVTL